MLVPDPDQYFSLPNTSCFSFNFQINTLKSEKQSNRIKPMAFKQSYHERLVFLFREKTAAHLSSEFFFKYDTFNKFTQYLQRLKCFWFVFFLKKFLYISHFFPPFAFFFKCRKHFQSHSRESSKPEDIQHFHFFML